MSFVCNYLADSTASQKHVEQLPLRWVKSARHTSNRSFVCYTIELLTVLPIDGICTYYSSQIFSKLAVSPIPFPESNMHGYDCVEEKSNIHSPKYRNYATPICVTEPFEIVFDVNKTRPFHKVFRWRCFLFTELHSTTFQRTLLLLIRQKQSNEHSLFHIQCVESILLFLSKPRSNLKA